MDSKILIVDDYSTMLRIIRTLLNQIGFKDIDEATDGKQAYEMFQLKEYDLVTSEWNMNPVKGIELLENIRNGDYNSDVPFIMITAESKTESVIKAKKAGVNNYIVKPFNAGTLQSKIEAVLKK